MAASDHADSRMDRQQWKEEAGRLSQEDDADQARLKAVEDQKTFALVVSELFAELDEDRGGSLDKSEVKKLLRRLGMSTDEACLVDIMLKMDPNGDGDVTLEEFLGWWREAGTEFRHKMVELAAEMAEQCAREDAATVLTQRLFRGYRARHGVMLAELGVHHIYMAPGTRCIHVLQLATVLRTKVEKRDERSLDLVNRLVVSMESNLPPEKQFFTQKDEPMRKQLLHHCKIAAFKAAHYLFEQGERSNDTFYFIVVRKYEFLIKNERSCIKNTKTRNCVSK